MLMLRPLLVALLAAPALAQPTQYQVTIVGGLSHPASGPVSYPLALNDNGRLVGYAYNGANFSALNWKAGVTTPLSGVSAFGRTFGNDVNLLGRVVGGGYRLDGAGNILESHALEWTGGTLTDLGSLGGHNAVALSINDAEQIVGFSTTPGESTTRAFIYQNGVMSPLTPIPGATESYAYSISNSGFVVGAAVTSLPAHPVIWHTGGVSFLPIPSSSRTGAANSVNNAGLAVGSYEINQYTGAFAAAAWSNGSLFTLPDLGGPTDYAIARSVNDAGQIVGDSLGPAGMSGVLWQNGHAYDLNNLIPGAPPGFRIISADSINNHAQIAAAAIINGQQTAVLLTPMAASVPAPAALAVLGTGAILTRRRR